ncbi:MAG: C4-dicarboxylate ABC transporter substrate-binding protein [Hyphomicrobiales bacterium]|nr:MAG: C4-dicarboxylate ABC transporter substrate-binding protein [Hyphomicrobiales bacterium]
MYNISRRTMVGGMIALTTPLLGGGKALAQETINLTIGSSHPLFLPWVGPLKTIVVDKSNKLLEERGSNYRINWTEAFGGTLYKFTDTMEAITQGIADIGWVGSLFEPAAMPLQNIPYYTPFTMQTLSQAINTMNRLNVSEEPFLQEWANQDIKFFGASCSGGYHLYTKKPIEKLSDMEGLKILGVPATAAWIEPLGATVINSALPANYNQLKNGEGDGVIMISTGAAGFKLYEQAPFVTRVDTGPITHGGFGINTDTFNSLPEDVQKVIAELGLAYSVENARLSEGREETNFVKMAEGGATVTTMPEEQRLDWVNRMPDIGKKWVEETEARGVPGGDMLKKFMATAIEEGAKPLRDWSEGV